MVHTTHNTTMYIALWHNSQFHVLDMITYMKKVLIMIIEETNP